MNRESWFPESYNRCLENFLQAFVPQIINRLKDQPQIAKVDWTVCCCCVSVLFVCFVCLFVCCLRCYCWYSQLLLFVVVAMHPIFMNENGQPVLPAADKAMKILNSSVLVINVHLLLSFRKQISTWLVSQRYIENFMLHEF